MPTQSIPTNPLDPATPPTRPHLIANSTSSSTSSTGTIDSIFDSNAERPESTTPPDVSPTPFENFDEYIRPQDLLKSRDLGSPQRNPRKRTPPRRIPRGNFVRQNVVSSTLAEETPPPRILYPELSLDDDEPGECVTAVSTGPFKSQDIPCHRETSNPNSSDRHQEIQDDGGEPNHDVISRSLVPGTDNHDPYLTPWIPGGWEIPSISDRDSQHEAYKNTNRSHQLPAEYIIQGPYGPINFVRYKKEVAQPHVINRKIYDCIINFKKRSPKYTRGGIYMYEPAKNTPKYVKIGKSENIDRRAFEWSRCKLPLRMITDPTLEAFDHHSLVESLVQRELLNERRKYRCDVATCKTFEHEEWFEVDKQHALHVVQRWRTWIMVQKPFRKQGPSTTLTPYWQWKVNKLFYSLSAVDWDDWTNPNGLEYLVYRFVHDVPFGPSIRAHQARKDMWFVCSGFGILSMLYIRFGWAGVCWGVIGLLAL